MDENGLHPPHALGRWGEARARAFLERRGWRVLAGNYRFGRREVDLVVARGDVVAFVEVKTRSGRGFGTPEEAITWSKRREIEAVARHFLARHRLDDVSVRFDAVAIVVDTSSASPGRVVEIHHIEDAWRPGWA